MAATASGAPPAATCPPAEVDPGAGRARSRGAGTSRRSAPSAATCRARRCTRATSSTSPPRCGTRGRRTTRPRRASSDRRAPDRPRRRGRARTRRSATRRTTCSRIATRRPSAARRRVACFRAVMTALGYDPDDATTTGDTPRALGNRIGAGLIAARPDDGANEAERLRRHHRLHAREPAARRRRARARRWPTPNHWQPLNLAVAATQNGIVTAGGVQAYIGSQLGQRHAVRDDARRRPTRSWHDPGPPPALGPSRRCRLWIADVIRKSAALDHTDGADDRHLAGRLRQQHARRQRRHGPRDEPRRPAQPYAPQVVPRGDFARVLAEFWADGPKSETPPGHWNVLANIVADTRLATRATRSARARRWIRSPWDVHVYLALNGAVHDAAITAWEHQARATTGAPDLARSATWAAGPVQRARRARLRPARAAADPGVIELDHRGERRARPASRAPASLRRPDRGAQPGAASPAIAPPRSAASAGSAPSTGSRTSAAPS